MPTRVSLKTTIQQWAKTLHFSFQIQFRRHSSVPYGLLYSYLIVRYVINTVCWSKLNESNLNLGELENLYRYILVRKCVDCVYRSLFCNSDHIRPRCPFIQTCLLRVIIFVFNNAQFMRYCCTVGVYLYTKSWRERMIELVVFNLNIPIIFILFWLLWKHLGFHIGLM